MKRKLALLFLAIITCTCLAFGLTACSDDLTVIEKAGESTVIETELAPGELSSAEDVIYAFVGKLRDLTTYQIDATGSTTASIVDQSIETTTIKNGNEFYKTHYSDSTFVHTEMVAFFKNDKVVYNANSTSLTGLSVASKTDYKKIYGVTPADVGILGYIINKDTVKYAEKAYSQSGVTTYRLVLDGNKAGANVRLQMLELGGLNDYPSFTSLTMLIGIKEDWTPVTISTTATYDVDYPIIGSISCTEAIKYTFSNVNSKVAIPDTRTFNEKIGSTPSDVKTRKNSSFDKLATALFSNGFTGNIELYTELFHNAPSGSKQNIPLVIDVDLYAKYDSEAFNNDEFVKCLKFRLDANFSDSIKNLASELTTNPLISKMIPEEVTQILQMLSVYDGLSIFNTADGTLYITLTNNGLATLIIEEIPLGDLGMSFLLAMGDSLIDSLIESIEQTSIKVVDIAGVVTKVVDLLRTRQGSEDISIVAGEYVSYLIDSSYQFGIQKLIDAIATANSNGDNELYATEYAKYNMIIPAMIGATVTGSDFVLDLDGNTFKQAYIEVFGKPQSLSETTLAKLTVSAETSVDESVFTDYDKDIEILHQYGDNITMLNSVVQMMAAGLPLSQENTEMVNSAVMLAKAAYLQDYAQYVTGIEYLVTFNGTLEDGLLVQQYKGYLQLANTILQMVSLDEFGELVYPPFLESVIAENWQYVTAKIFKDYLGADLYDALDWEFGW